MFKYCSILVACKAGDIYRPMYERRKAREISPAGKLWVFQSSVQKLQEILLYKEVTVRSAQRRPEGRYLKWRIAVKTLGSQVTGHRIEIKKYIVL